MNKCLLCGVDISSGLLCKMCDEKILEDISTLKYPNIEKPIPNYTALAHELDFYKNREALIEKLTGKSMDDLIRKLQEGWRLTAPKEVLFEGRHVQRGSY